MTPFIKILLNIKFLFSPDIQILLLFIYDETESKEEGLKQHKIRTPYLERTGEQLTKFYIKKNKFYFY